MEYCNIKTIEQFLLEVFYGSHSNSFDGDASVHNVFCS